MYLSFSGHLQAAMQLLWGLTPLCHCFQAEEPLDLFTDNGLDEPLPLPLPGTGDDGGDVEAEMDCALVAAELGVLSKVSRPKLPLSPWPCAPLLLSLQTQVPLQHEVLAHPNASKWRDLAVCTCAAE